jgi:hypothetical protein
MSWYMGSSMLLESLSTSLSGDSKSFYSSYYGAGVSLNGAGAE